MSPVLDGWSGEGSRWGSGWRGLARRRRVPPSCCRAQRDIYRWDYGEAQWDQVLLIYMGDDVAKVRRSFKPGGLVVSERFHVDVNPRIGTTPEELAKRYPDGFEILKDEVVNEVSVWGNRHHSPEKVAHFAARKL